MGHLLKINCAQSPLNLRILSSACVRFTLTTVQVLNLGLTYKKRITVYCMKTEWEVQQGVEQSRDTVNQSDEGGKYAVSSISWIGDKMYIPGSMQEGRHAVPHP